MSGIDVHSLGEKVGPLPIGVWLVGIGGGIAAALYLRNRGTAAAVPATTTDGGTLPTSGDPASTVGGASAGSPYYQTGNEPAYAIDQVISRWTTNDAWNKAIAHDVQAGVTAAEHPPAKPKPPVHKGSTHHAPAHRPAPPRKGPKATSYTVRRGDTLTAIADHFGTTVSHIQHLNPGIHNPNRINAGQRIRVK